MPFSFQQKKILGFGCAIIFVFAGAFLRIHMRVQTTLIGYDIGRLKSREATLLEQKSQLQMQLAKLTSKQHLTLMAASEEDELPPNAPLAAK